MFMPKVSIVIPVYNGGNYMQEAIDSALAQTYQNIEVIVVNDGSKDNGETDRIAKSYGDRIHYFDKPNGGVATALNLGIEKMTGEYFSWLSHDDKYKPQKIEFQIRELEKLEDKTTLLYGGYQNFSDEHGVFETIDFCKMYSKEELETHVFPVFHLALNGCTLLIHKSHFDRVGMFDPQLPTTQDYDLWFRMFRWQTPHCMPGCQVLSRSHPEQGSKALIDIHTNETESLWKKCILLLTDQEMIELSGSRYSFFSEIYDFFTNHCRYPVLNAFIRHQAVQELAKLHFSTDNLFTDDLFHDIYRNLEANIKLEEILKAVSETKKQPRIAFFLGTPNALGGLNRIVLQTAKQLCQYYDVWLVDTEKYNGTGYILDGKIHEATARWNIGSIVDMLSALQVDVLIGSYNCLDFSFQLYNEVRKTGTKVIAWNHEHYFRPYHCAVTDHLGYRLATLASVDAIVWLTHYSGSIYAIHHDNGIVIPNMISFIDDQETSQQTEVTPAIRNAGEKVIIGVARFDDEQKGLDKLLKAFAKIHTKKPNTKLLLLGHVNFDGTYCKESDFLHGTKRKTYKDLLTECKLPAGAVIVAGEVRDVRPYYASADLHLFSASYEGFGLVITEAAQYSIPTIAFSGNGYEDIIENGKSGYIVDNVDEMAEKATSLLEDEILLNNMGAHAKVALSRFSPEKVCDAWKELLDHVIFGSRDELKSYLKEKRKNDSLFSVETLLSIIREYEKDIALRQNATVPVSNSSVQQVDEYWKQQVTNMEHTLSWRITKPLRAVRTMMLNKKKKQ